MNKLISLAKVMGRIGQDEFVPSILKLARLSDKKYSEIARNIIAYILSDECIPKNRFYTQTTSHQSYSVPETVVTDIYKSVDLNVSKGNQGPGGLRCKFELEIYFPMTDEDYESELRFGTSKEFLDASLCRKWKKTAGDASSRSGNVYAARLFPRPIDLPVQGLGDKKWINELYISNPGIYSTLIHEITHIVDKTRTDSDINNDYKDSHNPDGSLSDDYLKSKIETQARLMQLFTYLREWVAQESPDLNAENYINSNEQKDPTMEKIILSLYNNDFIKFKDVIFTDEVLGGLLRMQSMKSDKTIKKYTARLFDMFNYLRGAFGLGAAGGSGSIQNIPDIDVE